MKMLSLLWAGAMVAMIPEALAAAEKKRAMAFTDLMAFQRIADPQVSPDGKWVVYAVTTVTDTKGNKSTTNLWLAPTDASKPARQLTTTDKKDRHPSWSPDGKSVLFESNRSGDMQLWIIDLAGGEARQLTKISTEASTAIWSRDGKQIAFVSAVYPEFSTKPFAESDALNKKKIEEIQNSPVKARVFTRLFYRHWDSYVEDKRQHLFVMSYDPATGTAGGPKDVTPGDRDAYPTSTTFSASVDFAFSPDGTHLIFTAVPAKGEAWSTNHDLCRVPVSGGSTDWQALTGDNTAADGEPCFSPDGKWMAYRAQKKAGYEADRWQLMVAPVNPDGSFAEKPYSVTGSLDRSVDTIVWLNDNQNLLFTVEENASSAVYRVGCTAQAAPTVALSQLGQVTAIDVLPDDQGLVLCQALLTRPAEVVKVALGGKSGEAPVNLSKANTKLLDTLDLPAPESVMVPVAGDVSMQMWILKPPGFDNGKKWPVAYLVHGGPQGAWENGWTYRWNAQLWAAQGYVVAMPNPRGSTGFGQKFTDEITGDWGGKCYDDLMKGVDYLSNLSYIDKDRIGTAGGSFGGYMMNWFAVNTGRFKCLISHCSVWNFDSMWGTTDELWFDEFEHGGLPWEKPKKYAEFSPHRKAGNLATHRTPMLIIHNDLDFRCPIGQGHELFSALQRLGVKSRFINFPDEGHWVLKPSNSELWYREVFAWMAAHVPAGGK